LHDLLLEQGTIPSKVELKNCITNDFIADANNFNKEAVKQDAENYDLKEENTVILKKLGLDEMGW